MWTWLDLLNFYCSNSSLIGRLFLVIVPIPSFILLLIVVNKLGIVVFACDCIVSPVLAAADLVLCRAGATTLAELAARAESIADAVEEAAAG